MNKPISSGASKYQIFDYTKSINKLFYLNSDILAKSSRKAKLVLVII